MQAERLESPGKGEEKKGRGEETAQEQVKAAHPVHSASLSLLLFFVNHPRKNFNGYFLMAFSGGTLGEKEYAGSDEEHQHTRGAISAQGQSTMVDGFVQKVAQDRAQGPGEDESRPKKQRSGNLRPQVK